MTFSMKVFLHRGSQAPTDVSHSVSDHNKQTLCEAQVKATCLPYVDRNCNCCIAVIKYYQAISKIFVKPWAKADFIASNKMNFPVALKF